MRKIVHLEIRQYSPVDGTPMPSEHHYYGSISAMLRDGGVMAKTGLSASKARTISDQWHGVTAVVRIGRLKCGIRTPAPQ